MSATLTSEKTRILNALASLASSKTGTNAMSASMMAPVKPMATVGVPNRSWTAESESGASESRLIANGNRDEDRTPAFAMLVSASTATPAMTRSPDSPRNCSAPTAIGVSESASTDGSEIPTTT